MFCKKILKIYVDQEKTEISKGKNYIAKNEKYKDNDFVVLGVPSRDFFQEYSEESAVAEFCSTEYGVEFPMFATVKVRGKKAHPFYKKLKEESGVEPTWNFNKYLISKEGRVVSTFKSGVKPDSLELISAIEEIL